MSLTFVYCRLSAADQTAESQIQEIQAGGFDVEHRRVVIETVSGSTLAMERDGFKRLLNRLEARDLLVVTKLDGLGRDAGDVAETLQQLALAKVRVYCLALGGIDLTGKSGKVALAVINAMAAFEHDLRAERIKAGLARVKAEGKSLGRPHVLSVAQHDEVLLRRAQGVSLGELAKVFGVNRAAIQRAEKRAAKPS